MDINKAIILRPNRSSAFELSNVVYSNRIWELPQNNIVATDTDQPDVLIWSVYSKIDRLCKRGELFDSILSWPNWLLQRWKEDTQRKVLNQLLCNLWLLLLSLVFDLIKCYANKEQLT